jgi:hypothetical protein
MWAALAENANHDSEGMKMSQHPNQKSIKT